jgi:hypothetical protein
MIRQASNRVLMTKSRLILFHIIIGPAKAMPVAQIGELARQAYGKL